MKLENETLGVCLGLFRIFCHMQLMNMLFYLLAIQFTLDHSADF